MKSLVEFINEAKDTSKSVTFDFTDIENAEDTLKSLGEHECATVDGNKVTIKVDADNADSECVTGAQDTIQQAVKAARDGSKSTNDEQYAQKVASLEKKVDELKDAISSFDNDEDDSEDSDDSKDEKTDDSEDKKDAE